MAVCERCKTGSGPGVAGTPRQLRDLEELWTTLKESIKGSGIPVWLRSESAELIAAPLLSKAISSDPWRSVIFIPTKSARKSALGGRSQINVGEYLRNDVRSLCVATHRNLDLAATLLGSGKGRSVLSSWLAVSGGGGWSHFGGPAGTTPPMLSSGDRTPAGLENWFQRRRCWLTPEGTRN